MQINDLLKNNSFEQKQSIFVMHRIDFLVKSNEYLIKEKYKHPQFDILQYILIDGEFHGAVLGKFRNGPYEVEDVIIDPGYEARKDEIIEAVYSVNSRE